MGERSHVRSNPLQAAPATNIEADGESAFTQRIRRRAPLFAAGVVPVAVLLVAGLPGTPQPMAAAFPVIAAHSYTAPELNVDPAPVAGTDQPMSGGGDRSVLPEGTLRDGVATATDEVGTQPEVQSVSTDTDDPVVPGVAGVAGALTGAAAGAAVGALVGAGVANAIVSPLTAAGVAVGAVAGFIAGIPFLPAGLVVVPIIGGAIGGAVFVVPATIIGGAVGALIGAPIGAALGAGVGAGIGLAVPGPAPAPDGPPIGAPAGDAAPADTGPA